MENKLFEIYLLFFLSYFVIFLKTYEKGKLAVRQGRKAEGPWPVILSPELVEGWQPHKDSQAADNVGETMGLPVR